MPYLVKKKNKQTKQTKKNTSTQTHLVASNLLNETYVPFGLIVSCATAHSFVKMTLIKGSGQVTQIVHGKMG